MSLCFFFIFVWQTLFLNKFVANVERIFCHTYSVRRRIIPYIAGIFFEDYLTNVTHTRENEFIDGGMIFCLIYVLGPCWSKLIPYRLITQVSPTVVTGLWYLNIWTSVCIDVTHIQMLSMNSLMTCTKLNPTWCNN